MKFFKVPCIHDREMADVYIDRTRMSTTREVHNEKTVDMAGDLLTETVGLVEERSSSRPSSWKNNFDHYMVEERLSSRLSLPSHQLLDEAQQLREEIAAKKHLTMFTPLAKASSSNDRDIYACPVSPVFALT